MEGLKQPAKGLVHITKLTGDTHVSILQDFLIRFLLRFHALHVVVVDAQVATLHWHRVQTLKKKKHVVLIRQISSTETVGIQFHCIRLPQLSLTLSYALHSHIVTSGISRVMLGRTNVEIRSRIQPHITTKLNSACMTAESNVKPDNEKLWRC